MNKNDLDRWLSALDQGDYTYGDTNEDRTYCALGVYMDVTMVADHKYTYKPTIRQRFRNLRERVGIKIGSKIAGFDLTPYDDSYSNY